MEEKLEEYEKKKINENSKEKKDIQGVEDLYEERRTRRDNKKRNMLNGKRAGERK